jgi:glycosyltransferase involved in cell wall biosynthesis
MMNLALHMLLKDEEALVGPLLAHVRPWVDEVVLGVDRASTDKTLEIAREYCRNVPGVVFEFPHDDYELQAHNKAQRLIEAPWTLRLDADEWPTEAMLRYARAWLAEEHPREVKALSFIRENRIDGELLKEEMIPRLYRSNLTYQAGLQTGPWGHHCQIHLARGRADEAPPEARFLHHKTASRQAAQDAHKDRMDLDRRLRLGEIRPLRLNVGGGTVRVEGFYNVDLRDVPGVDVVHDFTPQMAWNEHFYPYPGCLPFADESVDEIMAHHILEHITYHHAHDLLRDWARVLVRGGRLEIETPDLNRLCKMYLAGELTYFRAIQLMYAGQDFVGNFHAHLVTPEWLRGQLGCLGFERLRELPDEPWNVRMEAYKA